MKKTEHSSIHRKPGNLKAASAGTTNISNGVFREGSRLKAVRTTTSFGPLATGATVGAVAAGFYGVMNIIRYARNEKSGIQAVKDTTKGSVGVGLSTVIGITAANAVAGTSVALGSTVAAPLVAGTVAAYTSMAVWNKVFFRRECFHKTK